MKRCSRSQCSGRRLLPDFPEGRPNVVAVIVEDFGARAARTSVPICQKLSDAYGAPLLSPMRKYVRAGSLLLFPRFRRLRRRFIDGNPQTLFRQGKPFFAGHSSHAN